MDYTISRTLSRPYAATVDAVRAALTDQGFGILTEIDLKATLKARLDVDVAPEVILGACRPALAHQALRLDPSIAAVLPCNVVVRAVDDRTTVVEAVAPDGMVALGGDTLSEVAADASRRLRAALKSLTVES
jgi:uncharacterized protein (DUF302 family)